MKSSIVTKSSRCKSFRGRLTKFGRISPHSHSLGQSDDDEREPRDENASSQCQRLIMIKSKTTMKTKSIVILSALFHKDLVFGRLRVPNDNHLISTLGKHSAKQRSNVSVLRECIWIFSLRSCRYFNVLIFIYWTNKTALCISSS